MFMILCITHRKEVACIMSKTSNKKKGLSLLTQLLLIALIPMLV